VGSGCGDHIFAIQRMFQERSSFLNEDNVSEAINSNNSQSSCKHTIHLVGLELTANQVAIANSRLESQQMSSFIKFIQGSAIQLPFCASEFDAVRESG
jgi:ubiquinone/menaquinone biosynthesis C-methylase UbiE